MVLVLHISLAVIGFSFCLWAILYTLKDHIEDYWQKRFHRDFEKAIKIQGGDLSDRQVSFLMKRWQQERKRYEWVLKEIFRKSLTNEDEELAKNLESIELILEKFYEDEPYVDLPDTMRASLDALRSSDPSNKVHVDRLVKEVRSKINENERIFKNQRIREILGIVIGVAGLIVGVVGLVR